MKFLAMKILYKMHCYGHNGCSFHKITNICNSMKFTSGLLCPPLVSEGGVRTIFCVDPVGLSIAFFSYYKPLDGSLTKLAHILIWNSIIIKVTRNISMKKCQHRFLSAVGWILTKLAHILI